ncbi:MAG TPA: hypothetical protein DCS42_10215 [Nitrospiraceae bacterium]|nr:hypothetical protein [Nitrospiraceae bacterium]
MALHDINIAFQFEKVMLINDGSVLGSGSPEGVLTGPLLKEAFDVAVDVERSANGALYISHGTIL